MKSANAIPLDALPQLGWLQRFLTKQRLLRSPVFVRSCRILAPTPNAKVLFRVIYLAPRSDFADSERNAERLVSELIEANTLGSLEISEVQWRRGRLVTRQTLSTENEDVLRAIYFLKRLGHRELVVYERLDQPDSKSSPGSNNYAVQSTDSRVA